MAASVVHPDFANAAAAAAEKPKPIVPGQNRGDDPATDEGGASAKAGPKKPARKAAKKADKPAAGGEA